MHPGKRECAETLTGAAPEPQPQWLARPGAAVRPRQLTRDARADREMMIADRPNP